MIKENLIKYLAGLMDADGSLSFDFRIDTKRPDSFYMGLCLNISSSNAVDKHRFIESLPLITGMGRVYYYGDNKQYKSWKVFRKGDLEKILPRLIKHMVLKAKHWQWLLDKWRKQKGAVNSRKRELLTKASKLSRAKNVGPVKPKNHPTWGWVSGYLDGDGWYRYKYQKPPHNYWQIHVGAVAHINDISALYFLQSAFGGKVFPHSSKDNQQVFVWRRNLGIKDRSFALSFLGKIARHTRLKRRQIDQIIHHHQQRLSVPSMAQMPLTM